MMRPVVFVNGPPSSGKDTLAEYVVRKFPGFRQVKFSEIYGRPDLPHHAFETVKETPCDVFLGLSPREAYIEVSERYMKPTHGDEVFGRLLLDRMQNTSGRAFIISDSGFASEAQPILRSVGASKCQLVRLYAEGRGCSFKGDSRTHIKLEGVQTTDIANNYSIDEFYGRAMSRLSHIFQQMVGGE